MNQNLPYSHKEVKAKYKGLNVASIIKEFPGLKGANLLQAYEIYNDGKKKSIVIFPGKHSKDVEGLKKSSTFQILLKSLDSTIIICNWPYYPYIPSYSYAQLSDILIAKSYKQIYILGTSYGGYCALEFLEYIYKNKLNIKVKGLITIVGATESNDFRLPTRMKIYFTRFYGLLILAKSFKSFNTSYLKRMYSAFVDINKNSVIKNGNTLKKISILSITTKGTDLLVNNRKAAQKLRSLSDNVKILEVNSYKVFHRKKVFYAFNFSGGHVINRSEIKMVQEHIVNFLKNKNKI